MLYWAREFKKRLAAATSELPYYNLYLHKYYVDDGSNGTEAFPAGSRYVDGKIKIVEEEIENDVSIPKDERAAKLFNAIEISDFLKFTADWPSANESRYMALLDIQVRVVDNQVEYLFYSKPMVNPIKMRRDSAMPLKIQRESLVNMALTRLRNTKRELHAEHMPGILSKFSNEMKLSGHDAKFRLEVIQSAVRGYERQCDRADRGITPLHRPRSFEREKRRRKALLTKTSWYRPANSVIRVPATPDSELVNTINGIVKKGARQLGLKVKTVERAGSKIKDQLSKLDTTGCYWPDCYGCRTGEGGGSHTRRGAWYTGVCTQTRPGTPPTTR